MFKETSSTLHSATFALCQTYVTNFVSRSISRIYAPRSGFYCTPNEVTSTKTCSRRTCGRCLATAISRKSRCYVQREVW